MEPQIIDHYNELPYGINVIDKMNDELNDLQQENDSLKEKINQLPDEDYIKQFQMPSIIFDSLKEYQEFEKKSEEFEYWLTDYHKDDTFIDNQGDIDYLILRLNNITQLKNPIWCEYRIKVAIDLYNSFLPGGFDESDDNYYIFRNLVFGTATIGDGELPLTYRELSALYKPEWSHGYEYHNIFEIGYLNCKKCKKIRGYYDMEHPVIEGDNDNCSHCFHLQ